MNHRNAWFDEFQKNVSDLIAKSPVADIERNMKAMMTQTFSRMDLVTREEFDVQVQLLQRALQRLDALERRIPAPQADEQAQAVEPPAEDAQAS